MMCKGVQRCAKMCKDVQRCAKVCKDVQRCAKVCSQSHISHKSNVPFSNRRVELYKPTDGTLKPGTIIIINQDLIW